MKSKKPWPTERQTWTQERPAWCPHTDCLFRFRAVDAICSGRLPAPVAHDGDFNTHRLCLNGADKDGGVFDLQINSTDAWWMKKALEPVDMGT